MNQDYTQLYAMLLELEDDTQSYLFTSIIYHIFLCEMTGKEITTNEILEIIHERLTFIEKSL